MKWFTEIFLKSFNIGESQLSIKQYNVFMKYLTENFFDGYIRGKQGTINGLKIKAYEWSSIAGRKYYVYIKEDE